MYSLVLIGLGPVVHGCGGNGGYAAEGMVEGEERDEGVEGGRRRTKGGPGRFIEFPAVCLSRAANRESCQDLWTVGGPVRDLPASTVRA